MTHRRSWKSAAGAGNHAAGLGTTAHGGADRRTDYQHFQAATQINESTLSFIPRLVAMFITLIFAGPWMLQLMIDYIRRLFESIPSLIG